MVNKNIWLKKEFLVLVSLVLLLAISWGWTILRPIDINNVPQFRYSIPNNVNPEESVKNPLAVDVRDGIVAVTDSMGGNVKFFYASGNYIKTLKIKGGKYLSSLAFDDKGGLYVGDLSAEKVYYYPNPFKSQKNQKIFQSNISPAFVAYDKGSVYISDIKNSQVKVFNGEGREVTKPIAVAYANGLAVDGNKMFVADSNKAVVEEINQNTKSKLPVDFSLPRGLAFDSVGNLHVVDTFANKVKVLKGKTLLYTYGSQGEGPENFSFPNSITIDKDNNRIFIADKGNNRIQVLGW